MLWWFASREFSQFLLVMHDVINKFGMIAMSGILVRRPFCRKDTTSWVSKHLTAPTSWNGSFGRFATSFLGFGECLQNRKPNMICMVLKDFHIPLQRHQETEPDPHSFQGAPTISEAEGSVGTYCDYRHKMEGTRQWRNPTAYRHRLCKSSRLNSHDMSCWVLDSLHGALLIQSLALNFCLWVSWWASNTQIAPALLRSSGQYRTSDECLWCKRKQWGFK